MIFVDANVFLRHLTQPATAEDVQAKRLAARLFKAAEEGTVDVTTADATVAEVAFILTSAHHYGASRADAAATIAALLDLRGVRMASKAECLHALDLWAREPRLSFPDALAAAYSALRGYTVATFDRRLAGTPGVTPHAFDDGA